MRGAIDILIYIDANKSTEHAVLTVWSQSNCKILGIYDVAGVPKRFL